MPGSGDRERPARVLVAICGESVRLERGLRIAGTIAERTFDAASAAVRLVQAPRVDVLVLDGVAHGDWSRVLAVAAERNVWCLYLERPGQAVRLEPEVRARLVASVSIDSDEARIARTIELVVAAKRAPAAAC